jgi:transcriptional regulator with XRE-family HTH domain
MRDRKPGWLGERIKTARLRHGLSQAALARRIGISANAMNLIETGQTPDPRISRILAIAECLGMTVDALLGSHDTSDQPAPAADDEDERILRASLSLWQGWWHDPLSRRPFRPGLP